MHEKTRRYIDVLNSLVKNYNHTFHRSIKTIPASVTKSNETEMSKNLYPQLSKSAKPKFKIEIKFESIKQNLLLIRVIYQIGHEKYLKSHMSTKHFHP